MNSNGLSYPVHTGFWTNWSRGQVMGSTLTLTKADGTILIAFLAFFISFAGTRLWRVICFVLFYVYSSSTAQDTLYNQRQAVLRNSTNPVSATWAFARVIQAWSGGSRGNSRPMKRLLPLAIGAVLFAVALTIASGVSSQIVLGDEVLIDGSSCGVISSQKIPIEKDILFQQYKARRLSHASEYAQRCYESDSSSADCSVFQEAALPVTKTTNASCPFDDSLCLSKDSNIILDSGLIDSQDHLGLNWKSESRFQLRYKMQCAPLVTEGYRSPYKFGSTTYSRYQYGPVKRDLQSYFDCNCTGAINEDVAELWRQGNSSAPPGSVHHYSTSVVQAAFINGSVNEEWAVFDPIPELTPRERGDLTVMFLFPNEVMFSNKSEDIWYRATEETSRTMIGSDGGGGTVEVPLYISEEPAWPIGCVEQYQACKGSECTEMGSLDDAAYGISQQLGITSDFHGLVSYFSLMTSLPTLFIAMGKESLAQGHRGVIAMQAAPKPNEWHLDVTHWFATVLSSLQVYTAELASGKAAKENPELADAVFTPIESERQDFCKSQKIRSTAYTSFSSFWLFFILALGILITIIAAGLEPLSAFMNKYIVKKWSGYARLEWRANHILHLQYLAHEGSSSSSTWGLSYLDVPVTDSQAKLGILDVEHREGLPRLLGSREYSPCNSTAGYDSAGHEEGREKRGPRVDHVEALATTQSDSSMDSGNAQTGLSANESSHWLPINPADSASNMPTRDAYDANSRRV